jgi:hypothetical protein
MKRLALIGISSVMIFLCSCQAGPKVNKNSNVAESNVTSTIPEETNSAAVDNSKVTNNDKVTDNNKPADNEVKSNQEKNNAEILESSNSELLIHVKLKTISGKALEWDCLDLIEDDSYIYYSNDDGIYKTDKKDGTSKQIADQKRASKLLLAEGYIYFLAKSGENCDLYRVSTEGKDSKIVISGKQLNSIDMNNMDRFAVVNNKIYISYEMQLHSFDMVSGEIKNIIEDEGIFHVNNNNIYYIDHAERTFTIYKKNLVDMKTQIIVGNGKSDKAKDMYKDFVFLGDSMFYILAKSNGEWSLECLRGEKNTPIVDKLMDTIAAVYEYRGDIYYSLLSKDGKVKLIKYNIKSNAVSQVAELKSEEVSPYNVRFVNGYAYFNNKDNKVIGMGINQ